MGSVGAFSLTFDNGAVRARFERGVLILLAALAVQLVLDAVTQTRLLEADLVVFGVNLASRVAVALGASFFISSPQLLATPWGAGLARRVRRAALIYPAVPLIPLVILVDDLELEGTRLAVAVGVALLTRALDAIFLLVLVLATAKVLTGLQRPSGAILVVTGVLLLWSLVSVTSPTLTMGTWLSPLVMDHEMALLRGEASPWYHRATWLLGQAVLVAERKSVHLVLLWALTRVWRAARAQEERELDASAATSGALR